MAFRDLHAIGQLFAEYAGEGRLEVAHYDAYQRKLAYKREWYQFNRARVCAHQRAYYRANKATISAKDKARKNTEAERRRRRAKHKPGPSKPSQRAWYERKKAQRKAAA